MYKDYFRLTEMPFSIAPDPRFLFMSDRHREALAHLLYGVQGEGGIILLTGEVGTGKTTLCRCLLEQLPATIDVAFILNPRMSVEELLQTVCEELHIAVSPARPGTKAFVDAINAHLLLANGEGRRALLIIDEAQNLDPSVLEQLRLLTNLETNTRKLLQIILIGQPELQDMLARPEMRQVAQRVIARYHLAHLSQPETAAYVSHRLRIAGAAPSIFPDALMRPLFRATGGVPRLINLVCDRALLGTYVRGRQQVASTTLRQAVKEVSAARQPVHRNVLIGIAAIISTGVAVGLALSTSNPLNESLLSFPSPKVVKLATKPPTQSDTATAAPSPSASSSQQTQSSPANQVPVEAISPSAANAAVPAVAAAPAPVPVPTTAPTTAPGTLDWPASAAIADSEILAFQALFQAHGLTFDPKHKGDSCQQAVTLGMRCFASRGGLSDLLLLDQPVVLKLTTASGHEYHVALVGLANQVATLIVAGEQRRVPLTELAGSWSGRYVVLWKAPLGFGDSIGPKQGGSAVPWLRRTLAKIDGIEDDGNSPYDEVLARRVRAFQLAEGITPDGLVGPLTAIRLNFRAGLAAPRLMSSDRKG
jgi:general secretion pathway protein A